MLFIKKKFTILRDLKHLFFSASGFVLILIYSIFNLRPGERLYNGCMRFYSLAQRTRDGFLKRVAINFFENPLGYMTRDYFFLKANIDKDKLSTGVIQEYSDESLLGYGDVDFTETKEANAPLKMQQRGLILEVLEKSLSQSKEKKMVVEVGCGNGDVVAALASQYPSHSFIGVDFFIRNAVFKHSGYVNLSFVKGYAMDMLELGRLKGDVFFGSSTFCLFTPRELKRYFKAVFDAGFSEVVLSEPVWGGCVQTNDDVVFSQHIGRAVWFHNYAGYLRQAHFNINHFDFFPYKHSRSSRPDSYIAILKATR